MLKSCINIDHADDLRPVVRRSLSRRHVSPLHKDPMSRDFGTNAIRMRVMFGDTVKYMHMSSFATLRCQAQRHHDETQTRSTRLTGLNISRKKGVLVTNEDPPRDHILRKYSLESTGAMNEGHRNEYYPAREDLQITVLTRMSSCPVSPMLRGLRHVGGPSTHGVRLGIKRVSRVSRRAHRRFHRVNIDFQYRLLCTTSWATPLRRIAR